jgi:hypothetical protein
MKLISIPSQDTPGKRGVNTEYLNKQAKVYYTGGKTWI